VPESERMSEKEFLTSDALSASSSTHNLPSIAQSVLGATAARGGVSDEERLTWEEERQKLYLQLDDKVRHIVTTAVNVQSTFFHYITALQSPSFIITQQTM